MASLEWPALQSIERSFVEASRAAPMLSREREAALAQRWSELGDETALHELITSHLRLVVSLAARFRGYGLPLGDLVQEGSLGLMQAARRFDAAYDARFSTYATWWVRAAMRDFVLRNWSIVRTGTSAAQKTLFYNLRRLSARLGEPGEGRLGHEGTLAVARELAVDAREVSAMEARLFARDLSLNAPRGDDADETWQDVLADERPSPEEDAIDSGEAARRERLLAQALARLSERERLIVQERHLKDEETTLERLGGSLGISKERVRQIECRALEKLKCYMLAESEGGGVM